MEPQQLVLGEVLHSVDATPRLFISDAAGREWLMRKMPMPSGLRNLINSPTRALERARRSY
jgi:hypothetical protein